MSKVTERVRAEGSWLSVLVSQTREPYLVPFFLRSSIFSRLIF